MKGASVDLRKSSYVFCSSAKTTQGYWVNSEPCIELAADCSLRELGESARRVLEASKVGAAPLTRSWPGGMFPPLARLTGVKRWSEFVRGTQHCELYEDGSLITITPCQNRGTRGFFYLPDAAVRVPREASAIQIGQALNEAIKRCK